MEFLNSVAWRCQNHYNIGQKNKPLGYQIKNTSINIEYTLTRFLNGVETFLKELEAKKLFSYINVNSGNKIHLYLSTTKKSVDQCGPHNSLTACCGRYSRLPDDDVFFRESSNNRNFVYSTVVKTKKDYISYTKRVINQDGVFIGIYVNEEYIIYSWYKNNGIALEKNVKLNTLHKWDDL